MFGRLSVAEQREVEGHALVLLREKHFEGCGGLVLTDEHRVLIAIQAALLMLGRKEPEYFPGLRSILVYPAAFVGRGRAAGPGGLVTESRGLRLGESWHTPNWTSGGGGPVVLSWADVVAGAADDCDGHNVVLHELAHQLDGESQVMEGIPLLATRGEVEKWREVLMREMHRAVMIHNAGARGAGLAGGPGVVNPYGFQSPAEFFACAVEAFYERPAALAAVHPELHELFVRFFGVDPRAWERCEVGVCVRRGVVA